MTTHASRRGPRRQLVRGSDGTLHDLTTDQGVAASELRDLVAAGGFFEARREDGSECTMQVLTEVLQDAVVDRHRWRRLDGDAAGSRPRAEPWGSFGPPGPLGPLGGLSVLGRLTAAVPSPAALEPLAQMISLWGSRTSGDPWGAPSGQRARRHRGTGAAQRAASTLPRRQRDGSGLEP